MKELSLFGPDAPFYIGLKLLKLGNKEGAIAALLSADGNVSPVVQQNRLKTLIPLLLETKQTETALTVLENTGNNSGYTKQTWYRSLLTEVRFAKGQYQNILDMQKGVDASELTQKELALGLFSRLAMDPKNQKNLDGVTAFFLTGPATELTRDLFTTIRQAPNIFLSQTISDAVRGRLFILDRSYGDALYYFKQALRRNRYLFEAYPDLLSDLGKAYQYSGVAKEGIKLFLDWESTIRSNQSTQALITNNDKNEIRFKLLFFAGRMARQVRISSDALNYFYRALPLAPDPQQRDACIWYILDSTLEADPNLFPSTLETLIPIWSAPSYFDDLLDKICTNFTTEHNWTGLLKIFKIIYQKADSPVQARYAYILARAITEGYLPLNKELNFLGLPAGVNRSETAKAFYTIAFETDKASLYYRSLAAAFLGTQIQLIPETEDVQEITKGAQHIDESTLIAYLTGFFSWGCADIALPYVLEYKDQLTTEEIRRIAQMFGNQKRWGDQIQLISRALFSKQDYTATKTDYELLYPLPFRDLMEPLAKQHTIPIEIFYGLVRTESAFIPDINSNAGAKGLTQLMLATAQDAAWRIKREGGPDFTIKDSKDLEDPETNLYIGAWYLSYLIKRTGSPLLALASYNGGMTRVRNWRASQATLAEDIFLETIPITETREYSRKVLAAAAVYGYLYFNLSMEKVFADIFPVQQSPLEAR